jgi:sulfite reductase alpha subunit-like flavoprotein
VTVYSRAPSSGTGTISEGRIDQTPGYIRKHPVLTQSRLIPRTQKKKIIIFYGSQTGSAEDYGTRIAKEAKHRFGLSSLVCDPEE